MGAITMVWCSIIRKVKLGYSPSTANVTAMPPPSNDSNNPVWNMYTTPWTADPPNKYIMCSHADKTLEHSQW